MTPPPVKIPFIKMPHLDYTNSTLASFQNLSIEDVEDVRAPPKYPIHVYKNKSWYNLQTLLPKETWLAIKM